jgi:hypothetical protein
MKCEVAAVRRCGGAVALAVAMIVAASSTAVVAMSQADVAKKANVAISGCLLRQGYATLVVDEARVDGKGDAAATAQPTVAKPGEPLTAPPRWVLDNAGPHTSHVGERVQLLGVSDWVTNPGDYPIPTGEPGPPPPAPHIEVISLKVLAPMCS